MSRVTAATVGYPFLFMLIAVSSLELSGKIAVSIFMFAATVTAIFIARAREWNITAVISGLLAAAIASAMFAIADYNLTSGYSPNVKYPAHLVGTVISEPEYDGRYRYVIEAENGDRIVLISNELDNGRLYSRFEGDVVLYLQDSVSDGAKFYAHVQNDAECSFTDQSGGLMSILQLARDWSSDRIDYISDGQTAEFLKGVMLGDDLAISDELNSAFRATGLSHVLVISGSHLTTILLVITAMFTLIRARRRSYYLIALMIMLAYMVLVGFGASVVRAGICCFAIGIGFVIMRDSNPVNSLGAAALITGIISPYTASSIGFQLSFFSAFGIVTVGLYLLRKINSYKIPRLIKAVSGLFVMTLTAQIFTLPIIIPIFGNISLMSVFANLLVGFAVDIAVVCAVIYLILSAMFLTPIAALFGMLSSLFAKHCVSVANNLSHRSLSFVKIPQGVYAVLICVLFCTFALCIIKRGRFLKLSAALVSISLAIAAVSTVYYNGCVRITAAANGAYIISYRGDSLIVGCGDSDYETRRVLYYSRLYCYDNIKLVVSLDDSIDSLVTVINSTLPDAVVSDESQELNKRYNGTLTTFESSGSLTPFEGCMVYAYDGYVLVDVGGIRLALPGKYQKVPKELNADFMICAKGSRGSAKTAVVIEDSNPLALSANRVYNASSDHFSLVLSSDARIISAE